jgi:hypothetical protein
MSLVIFEGLMRTLLIALLTLSLMPAVAHAGGNGGGGTKPTAVIKVKNSGSNTLAVIVDPTEDILADLDAGTLTTSDFLAAGGRFVGRNSTTTFAGLQGGPHTVVAVFVSNTSNSATVSTVGTADVTVNNGQTRTLTARGSVAGGATLNGP